MEKYLHWYEAFWGKAQEQIHEGLGPKWTISYHCGDMWCPDSLHGLHSYLRHTILMFNPTSLDDVLVQATHLEARGKNVTHDVGKSSKPIESKNKDKKKLKWKEKKTNTVKKDKPSCTRCKEEGHGEAHCWSLHPELKPKMFGSKERKNSKGFVIKLK